MSREWNEKKLWMSLRVGLATLLLAPLLSRASEIYSATDPDEGKVSGTALRAPQTAGEPEAVETETHSELPSHVAEYGARPAEADPDLEAGIKFFQEGHYEKALTQFYRSRLKDHGPGEVSAWIYELRTLLLLHRKTEAKRIAGLLLKENPALQDLPLITKILSEED